MGFIILVSSLFLAGAATVTALGLQEDRRIIEWVVLSFAFGALVLPVATFALGRALGGLPASLPYYLLAVFGIALGLSLGARHGKYPTPSITRNELIALVLTLGNVFIIAYYFDKYPIFPPEILVHDYLAHLQTATDPGALLYGWLTNSLYGVTQITSYLYLAYGLIALGGVQIVSLRYSMLVLGAFFPMVVYYTSVKLLRNEEASLFTLAAYCFVTPFWVTGLITSGLYGEFYVGLLSLLLVWTASGIVGPSGPTNKGNWIAFFLTGALILFAHATSLMLVLAIFLYFVLDGALRRTTSRKFWGAIIAVLLLGSAVLITDGGEVLRFLLGLVSPQGLTGVGNSFLGSLLGFSPFMVGLYEYVGDLAILFILITLAAFLLNIALQRSGSANHAFPVIWFLVPLAASTLSGAGAYSALRYSFYALVPAAFIFGLGYLYVVKPIFSSLGSKGRATSVQGPRAMLTVVVVLFLIGASLMGAAGTASSDAAGERGFTIAKGVGVYDSMLWIKGNTPSNSIIFSVGLPWYSLSSYVDARTFAVDDLGTPRVISQDIAAWHNSTGETSAPAYVAMFRLLRNSSGYLSSLYLSDARYTLIWNNSMVLVFRYSYSPA